MTILVTRGAVLYIGGVALSLLGERGGAAGAFAAEAAQTQELPLSKGVKLPRRRGGDCQTAPHLPSDRCLTALSSIV